MIKRLTEKKFLSIEKLLSATIFSKLIKLDDHVKKVLNYILSLLNYEKIPYPSQSRIAEMAGVRRETVNRSVLPLLEYLGILQSISRGHMKTKVYIPSPIFFESASRIRLSVLIKACKVVLSEKALSLCRRISVYWNKSHNIFKLFNCLVIDNWNCIERLPIQFRQSICRSILQKKE